MTAATGGTAATRGTAANRVVGVVLAAGTGSRFGGGKMHATLDGAALPAHALAAARAAGLERLVIVLGRDAVAVWAALAEGAGRGDVSGGGIPALRVINPAPERGLASSLRIGLAAATAAPTPDGVLILLGDQPRVRADVIAALLAADPPPDAVAVAPRYADDAAPNPVLLLPAGFGLVAEAAGDRGLGSLLAAVAARVVRVAVTGANPDVDTPADLTALAAPSGAAVRTTGAPR